MKQILVLGAGLSSSYLISHLLQNAQANDWCVTVGDYDVKLARKAVNRHARGSAIRFNVNDSEMRVIQIEKADIVVNMLPPTFQNVVARDCIHHTRPMISASYQSQQIRNLDPDAKRRGVLILTEMGLDPGIDHMIAMSMIEKVRAKGGKIKSFKSYGGALPAPDSRNNPLNYFITWNPRNVVMAGEHGAQYMEKGKVKLVPFHNVFQDSWLIEVDGIGTMEVYPNRESLSYQASFEINRATTLIRGTIRYPGWCETWLQIVRLGIPNEHLRIPNLHKMTYREFVHLFIPLEVSGSDLETRVANFLHINPTGKIMENLRWLGLFSEELIGKVDETPAAVMIDLIKKKLKMDPDSRDMIILINELEASYPSAGKKREKITVTLIEKGECSGFSAVTKTVGLPMAIGVRLILAAKLPLTGCHIPTHPAVYVPLLKELKKEGLKFKTKVTAL